MPYNTQLNFRRLVGGGNLPPHVQQMQEDCRNTLARQRAANAERRYVKNVLLLLCAGYVPARHCALYYSGNTM